MKNIITKIKKYFKTEKISYYKEKEIELQVLLDTLHREMHKQDDYNYWSSFSIENFLENKIEKYLNTNINKYFNISYWQNKNLDDICKNILDKKLEEKFDKYFTEETEKYITEKFNWLSMYDIRISQPFEKFLSEYFEKNKVDIAISIRKIVDNDKFIDILTEKIWEDIWDMMQDKLKENCKY